MQAPIPFLANDARETQPPEVFGLTDSRRATIGATRIYEAFRAYRQSFEKLTRRAQQRFERRDWQGGREDSALRLTVRKEAVEKALEAIQTLFGARLTDKFLWVSMKAVYSSLISQTADWELAETFFNSLTRRVFATVGVDEQIEFVRTDFSAPPTSPRSEVYRRYTERGMASIVSAILRDLPVEAICEDIVRDAHAAARQIGRRLSGEDVLCVDIASEVFYRGKAAYLVGRIVTPSRTLPLALALLHHPTGLVIDAVLMGRDCVAILFSFTHSYFHVAAERPYDLVRFIHQVLPCKRLSELYIALGYHKHGKTEMYRELLSHLRSSSRRFERAPGVPGMVMTVFTQTDYDLVFKLIKDRFDPPKETSADAIKARYNLVFHHDRAGRLIDAQAFEHLEFDRRHFSPELLSSLEQIASNVVTLTPERVVIRHLYIERRVTPLDLYLKEATRDAAVAAVTEYGHAIKDLACSNIFPGDMLVKNFGVTRLGRVVFYDYDELCLLEQCNFRTLPEPQTFEQEMAAEPWYYVGPDDVFPEQLLPFLGIPKALRGAFTEAHGDLLEPDFWQGIQRRLAEGEVISILPYRRDNRLGAGAAFD